MSVPVPPYIQHATSDYIISESFKACGDPYGTLYGPHTWNGEAEDLETPPKNAIPTTKGPDILAADQIHDAISPFKKKTATKQSNCAKIKKKSVVASPAGPAVSNRPAMGNELEDYMILALNPPEYHTVQNTLQHIIHEDKIHTQTHKLMFSHNHNDTSPSPEGDQVEMPYIHKLQSGFAAKMGSPMLSEYMKGYYCPQCQQFGADQKIYFHVITDCGPSVAQMTRTVSNDLDSATNITPNCGKFFTVTHKPAEMAADNLYTMEIPDTADPTVTAALNNKHRALAQHMMVRILYEATTTAKQLFPGIGTDPPCANTQIAPRGNLTNQHVLEMITWVNSHPTIANEPSPDHKTFLLQDMYTNWLWQITLIHMFNVKYNVDNDDIAATTIETMKDRSLPAGIEEKKAHLNAFYRLTRFIFRMDADGKMECKVISAAAAGADLESFYINIVNKFYEDFWKYVPDINTSKTSSVNWLTRGHSMGWKKWAISQSGVATFMRNAFKHGNNPGGGKLNPPKHTFTQFVATNLGDVSIHNVPPTHTYPSIYNNTENTKCRTNDKLDEDCHCNTSQIDYCKTNGQNTHPAGQPHPYGLENYDDNAHAPKIPKQCYPHKDQFTAALAAATNDAIYLEQLSQIITVQFLKTVGDQLHFADFMSKSKYLNPASIRPILQINDRPLCAISLKYLAAKESYGILLMSGAAVFIDQYANHSGWKGSGSLPNPEKNLKVDASTAPSPAQTDCEVTLYAQNSGKNVQVPSYKHFCIAWHKDTDVVQSQQQQQSVQQQQQAAAGSVLGNWSMVAQGLGRDAWDAAANATWDGIMLCRMAVDFISQRTPGMHGGGGDGDFVIIDPSYYDIYVNYWKTSEAAEENCIERMYEVQHISTTYMKFIYMWTIAEYNISGPDIDWLKHNFVYWVVCHFATDFVEKVCNWKKRGDYEENLQKFITSTVRAELVATDYNTWNAMDECQRDEYIQEQIYIFIDMIDVVTFAIDLSDFGRNSLIEKCIYHVEKLYHPDIFPPIKIFLKEHQTDAMDDGESYWNPASYPAREWAYSWEHAKKPRPDASHHTPRKMSVKHNLSVLDSKLKRIINMYERNKSNRNYTFNSSRGKNSQGGKLIRNKRSKKYKKTKRGKKSRRGKKSQKKKKVKCVKKSRKCRNTRMKRHHSKKL